MADHADVFQNPAGRARGADHADRPALKRFAYLRDPLFLAAVGVYGLNRWWWKPAGAPAFFQSWLSDFLLIPAALPVLLRLHRVFGWRRHDQSPSWSEIGLHLGVWAVVCEGIGPLLVSTAVADPWDVLAYAAGALFAGLVWRSPLAHDVSKAISPG